MRLTAAITHEAPWCVARCLEVTQRGGHVKLRNTEGRPVIVSMHRELAPGALRSILRQAALSADEFTALL